MLQIRLLGKVEIVIANAPPPLFRGKSGQWLMGILALHANRPVERDWLAGTLWPDSAPDQGRANLRRTLTDVRRALGNAASHLTNPSPHTVSLGLAESEADVLAFRAGDFARYGGPLMPGCPLEWVEIERRALEETYLTRGEQRATSLALDAALPLLEALRACAPLRESLLRLQLSTLCGLGNRAEAQQYYYRFRCLLLSERLGEPSVQTQQHWKTLQNLQVSPEPTARSDTSPSSTSLKNNLPSQLTSFIGREREIADVTGLIGTTRLLTLSGAGGSGKTRLAFQAAEGVLGQYSDGVWMVELAPLSDPGRVAHTVAQALGVRETAGQTMSQTLTLQLKTKKLLIVLDNCEHLVAACAQFTAALLRSCPNVQVLATSREPLGIAGEQIYGVPSLSSPTPQESKKATADSLSLFESVRLFIDRARAIKTNFTVTNANAPALAQVCYRLDGIPLALELAAARIRSLTVEQINDKLDNRFHLLTGGDRSALPRQQTLRALVDWSYDLLTNIEKTVFARLSVFAGGWTLEAAESVCAGEATAPGWVPVEEWEVLDVLTSLLDKSLVFAEPQGGVEGGVDGTRYQMLETLKQYGAEKLDAGGETVKISIKHRNYFVAWLEEVEPQRVGPGQAAWLTRIEIEHDNLRAVLDECAMPSAERSANAEAAETAGLRIVASIWQFWDTRGYPNEGIEQAIRALDRGQARKATPHMQQLRAKAMVAVGALATAQGDYKTALTFHGKSLALYRDLDHKPGIATALRNMGILAYEQGNYETAQSFLEESLALRRELGDKPGLSNSLNNLGILANDRGNYGVAQALMEESLALRRELGDKLGIAISLNNLGSLAFNQGDYKRALLLYEDSFAFYRDVGDKRGTAISLNKLGSLAQKEGDYATARARYEESLMIFRALESRWGIAYCLDGFALVCAGENDTRKAVVVFGAATALRERLGAPLPPTEQAEQNREMEKARLTLDAIIFSTAYEQGRAMSCEQAADYALSDAPPRFH